MEQKNSHYVRQFVGYARYDTSEELAALSEVYRVLCTLLNLFYPSTKLIAKHREQATLRKTYNTPQTPFSRVLASPFLPLKAKEQLSALKARYDPVQLRYELDMALEKLHYAHSHKKCIEICYEES